MKKEIQQFKKDITFELKEFYKAAYNKGYADASKNQQPDLLGRENVCFSFANELPLDDDRLETYKQQRIERDFDDSELWNLDTAILRFILPRLKAFNEITIGYPGIVESEKTWHEIIQSMINYIEAVLEDNDENMKKYSEGWDNFYKYFFNLWD